MGDRAFVILKSGINYSPVMYLHWHAQQVQHYVNRLKEVMETRGEDLNYAFARLLGVVHNDIAGNLSLGCWNLPKGFSEQDIDLLVDISPGDGGFYVVDLKNYTIATYAGYGLDHQHQRDGGEADRVAVKAVELSRDNPPAGKPAIAVVLVRGGLVEEVRANHPLHVLVEDWDDTEVRPSHNPIVPDSMLPGEEAELTHFFEPTLNQGE